MDKIKLYENVLKNMTFEQYANIRRREGATMDGFTHCICCGNKFEDNERIVAAVHSELGQRIACIYCLKASKSVLYRLFLRRVKKRHGINDNSRIQKNDEYIILSKKRDEPHPRFDK